MKKFPKLIFTLMISCILIGSVFARVEVNSETFDLGAVKAVWNKDDQTLYINGNGKVDKTKWEKLKETLSLREDVASAVRITFTDGASFPEDASSFFENVKGEIRFQSTIPLDTSNVVNMRAMFAGTKFNQDISSWNTSNVTDMSHMFSGATAFNQPLNTWDVSNVTNMSYMFAGVRYVDGDSYKRISSFNQPLWKWNVSKVTNMSHMFDGARNFNQDISNWNTSSVTDMSWLFAGALDFNEPLNNWNTSKVTTMAHMFDSLRAKPLPAPDNSRFFNADKSHRFNQDISNWNTSKVTDMSYMFAWAYSFYQDIGNWDTSKVTDMSFMFAYANAFNQPLKNWNTSNVTATTAMFCFSHFNQEIGDWDTSKVTSMKAMFCHSPFNQDISKWNTSKVTDMSWMFENTPFNKPIGNWDVSKVTDMSWMFINAWAFNQPLNNWDVSKVTDMHGMFKNAGVFNQPLDSWDVSKVTDMFWMFNKATTFNQPLNSWDVSKVTDMHDMFMDAKAFDQDLSNWNPVSLNDGNRFILRTNLSVENNDKILLSWIEKLPIKEKKKTKKGEVPQVKLYLSAYYCESEDVIKLFKDKGYDLSVRKNINNQCEVIRKTLTKGKDNELPISFTWYINIEIDSPYIYEEGEAKPDNVQDIGLTYTKKQDTNEMTYMIKGLPNLAWWPYKMTVISRDGGKKLKKTIVILTVESKRKRRRHENTIITPNTNEKTNDIGEKDTPSNNWAKDTPKQETPVVDKDTEDGDLSLIEKEHGAPTDSSITESGKGKRIFSDDEIFNPTIANGQCYTRRPYLWIKDSATIITDEEFKKALSFLRTYEMTMFDSVDGYDPYRDLSREEAAKIFSNFAINVLCRKPDLNLKVNYSDVENADPMLKPYITLAYQLGVMKGSRMGDGLFRPFDKITKAEVNAVLVRMILKSYLDESQTKSKTWYNEYNKVAIELWIINRGAGSEHISRNNTALMLFRAYKQQVFDWRLIDYYSYVLLSRDLFVK